MIFLMGAAAAEFAIICGMERCFNIAGPCFPDEHYMLPALERLPGIIRWELRLRSWLKRECG